MIWKFANQIRKLIPFFTLIVLTTNQLQADIKERCPEASSGESKELCVSTSEMINGITKKISDIRPMVAITKLDECWVGSEEFSSLALNNARIGIVTGTKVIIDSIIEANENSLTKYMKENFENV